MGRTKANKKNKYPNLPPGITPETIKNDFDKILPNLLRMLAPTHGFAVIDYQQAKGLCTAFADNMMNHVKAGSNAFEIERLGLAATEIYDLLKDKYDICAMDAAALLVASGMELLNRCDDEYDKKR